MQLPVLSLADLVDLARRQAEALEEHQRLGHLRTDLWAALNQPGPLADTLRTSASVIHRHTAAHFVRIWTLNDAERVLELEASVGRYTHTDGRHARIPVGQFKIGRIADTRTPHHTDDVLNDPAVDHTWAAAEGLVAFAGHPLVSGERTLGVLAMFSRRPISAAVQNTLAVSADAIASTIHRVRTQRAAGEAEARHRAIVDSALDCILSIDREGRVVEFNPAAERTFGYTRAEVLGCPLDDLILPPAHRGAHRAGIARYLRTGQSDLLCRRLVGLPAIRKDGAEFPVELTVVPTELGGALVFTAFLRDITAQQAAEVERRAAEEELMRAKAAAEEANRAKSHFLANMSHEFRTPMAAVVGYADMLHDPRLTVGDRVRATQAIARNGRHLITLINDVLDLAKIESGHLEVEALPFRLGRVVDEAVSVGEVAAAERGVELVVTPVGPLPRTVTSDPTRVRQVLDNLISNAVKFSHRGGRVEVRLRADDASEPRLVVEVEDHGIGIPPEVLARLFHPFTQADASTTRKYGGTGLGLSICRRLMHVLGGELSVRSEPEVGSCFTATLPLSPTDLADLVDPADAAVESRLATPLRKAPRLTGQVLLVDDNADNRTILRFVLESAGLQVTTADDGREAVERATEREFDVILMDMQMPVLDGYAATSHLRQMGYGRSIVALTAHAMRGDEEKCLLVGCNAYLTKPVDTDRLLAEVARQIPSRSWVV
ncbi:MAG: ATP-binding protein, partial [Fimbriiglobus sp.]|nr:ATP-binding protein [Fimbriiglobus sp.]